MIDLVEQTLRGIGDTISATASQAGQLLPAIVLALIIGLLTWWLSSWAMRATRRVLAKMSTEGHVDLLVARLVRAAVIVVGAVTALGVLGVNVGALLASLGLVGLTLGLALKDVLANYVAGIMLLLQRPFTIGDSVSVGAEEGTVIDVHSRATVLRAPDGRTVHIPNSTVFAATVVNASQAPQRRFEVRVQIPRDCDLPKALEDALETLGSLDGVLDHPGPDAALAPGGADTMRIVAHGWVDTSSTSLGDTQNAAYVAMGERLAVASESA